MAKILIVYYSGGGNTEAMAHLVEEGVMSEKVEVVTKSVEKTKVDELLKYDGIIVGTPTRFGNMSAQMRHFFDQTGPLWVAGALIGKVGSAFTSTSTGGGNETTLVSVHATMLHHGMVVVGLPYSAPDLPDISEVKGGSPYGAGTIAAPDGSRVPSQKELNLASFQGHHIAKIAKKLAGGLD